MKNIQFFSNKTQMTKESQMRGTVSALAAAIQASTVDFSKLAGTEGFTDAFGNGSEHGVLGVSSDILNDLRNTSEAGKIMVTRALGVSSKDQDLAWQLNKAVAGNEAFERNNAPINSTEAKAAGIMINKGTSNQLEAIEALYPTVAIGDDVDVYKYGVNVIGLSNYAGSKNATSLINQTQPICSILRDSNFMIESPLKIVPVYVEGSDSAKLFVPETIVPPRTVIYSDADRLERPEHLTNYLKVGRSIQNYLGLCVVPGLPEFQQNDVIEPSSLKVEKLLVKFQMKDGTSQYARLDLTNVTNTRFAGMDTATDANDSFLNLPLKSLTLDMFFDPKADVSNPADRTPSDVFDDIKAAGYEGTLDGTLSATFNKNGNRLDVRGGDLVFGWMIKDGTRYFARETDNAELKTLIDEFDQITFEGYILSANLTNSNRLQFGYRLEIFTAVRALETNRRNPLSATYPLRKEDIYGPGFDSVVDEITNVVRAQVSAEGYRQAKGYIEHLITHNGYPIVGNDQNGTDVQPSRFFLNITGIRRTINLSKNVSTLDTMTAMDNISAYLVNELTELKAALETLSGLAAVDELNQSEKRNWLAITHQNLLRYIFRKGEGRTTGGDGDTIKAIATNYDEHIGKIWLVPESKTTQDSLDIFGGLGICLVKENIVTSGAVTRDNRDFGAIISLPTYQHHNIGCLVGELFIEDAEAALQSLGLISNVNKHQIMSTESDTVKDEVTKPGDDSTTKPTDPKPTDPTPPAGDDSETSGDGKSLGAKERTFTPQTATYNADSNKGKR